MRGLDWREVDGSSFDPPEMPGQEYPDVEEEIELDLEATVILDDDGYLSYEDDSWDWLLSQLTTERFDNPLDPMIRSEKFWDLRVTYADNIAEAVLQFIVNNMSNDPGKYRVTGKIRWPYTITNVWGIYRRDWDEVEYLVDSDDVEMGDLVIEDMEIEAI